MSTGTLERRHAENNDNEGRAVETFRDSIAPSTALMQFSRDASAAYGVALSLANTPFVPTSYKKRGRGRDSSWLTKEEVAATVTAAWLAGAEIGLSPMQSLQSIDVIEGRPALNALSQRALVQAAGHEVWIEERTADSRGQRAAVSVTVRGRRKGSDHVAEATWSLDRARQAGLLGKDNWQNHPEAMCFARASSEVCRQIAADVLMGLAYTAEELTDSGELGVSAGANEVSVRKPEAGGQEQPSEPAPPQQPQEPTETPERTGAPGETPEQPDPQEQQLDGYEAEPGTAAYASDNDTCANPSGDGRFCSREEGHTGRHHYGPKREAVEQPADAPVPDEALQAPVSEPEPEQFRQPTDEELEEALEQERRERAEQQAVEAEVVPERTVAQAQEEARSKPQPEPQSRVVREAVEAQVRREQPEPIPASGPEPVVVHEAVHESVQEQLGSEHAEPAAEEPAADDDPWADFR